MVLFAAILAVFAGAGLAAEEAKQLLREKVTTWADLPYEEAVNRLKQDKTLCRKHDASHNTLLHLAIYAGRDDLAALLVDLPSIALNAKNLRGETPLHLAVQGGRIDVIRHLLRQKANPDIANAAGDFPVHLAAGIGNADLLELLLDGGANLNAGNKAGETPMLIACRLSHINLAEKLLRKGVQGKFPPEMAAAMISRALDNYDADMLLRLGYSSSKLSIGLENGQTFLNRAVASSDRKLCERLLKAGVDINLVDSHGRTPAHVAAGLAPGLLPWLTSKGLNLQALDDAQMPPLFFAANYNASASVRFLVKQGCKPGIAMATGQTPLHIAAGSNATAALEALLGAGADIEARDASDSTPLHHAARFNAPAAAALLIKRGADRFAVDAEGRTPLHVAAGLDNAQVAEILLGGSSRAELAAGPALADVADYQGETPFFLAVRAQPPFWEARPEVSANCFELLLNWGADFRARNHTGETPLHLLVKTARPDLFSRLWTIDLPVNTIDESGNTPLHACIGLSFKSLPEVTKRKVEGDYSDRNFAISMLLGDYNPPVGSSGLMRFPENRAEVESLLRRNRLRILQFLVDKGGDVFKPNSRGLSVIEMAQNLDDEAALAILAGTSP